MYGFPRGLEISKNGLDIQNEFVNQPRGKLGKAKMLVSYDMEDIAMKLQLNTELCAIEALPVVIYCPPALDAAALYSKHRYRASLRQFKGPCVESKSFVLSVDNDIQFR